MDRIRKALQPVDHGDRHVLYAAVLQLIHDLQPELRPFGLLDPDAEHVLLPAGRDAQRQVNRLAAHDPFIPDLYPKRVEDPHRVDTIQGPALTLPGLPASPATMPRAARRPTRRTPAVRERAWRRHGVAGQRPRRSPPPRAAHPRRRLRVPSHGRPDPCHHGPSTASGSQPWPFTRSGQLMCYKKTGQLEKLPTHVPAAIPAADLANCSKRRAECKLPSVALTILCVRRGL